jgi:hypothetical protein
MHSARQNEEKEMNKLLTFLSTKTALFIAVALIAASLISASWWLLAEGAVIAFCWIAVNRLDDYR